MKHKTYIIPTECLQDAGESKDVIDMLEGEELRRRCEQERVAFGCPERITTKRIRYDAGQLSLF